MSSFWNSPAWTMAPRAKTSTTASPSQQKNTRRTARPRKLQLQQHRQALPRLEVPPKPRRIGEAPREALKASEGPGPGDYNLAKSKSGPKITIGAKGKASSLGDALQPGPGNYNVSTEGVYKHSAAFTMGAKYGSKVEDPEPGPGAYSYGKEFKQNGPKMGTSKRAGLEGKN
jgi:hypothetical protein